MITGFILWAAALGGMAATLAVIIGLFMRSRSLSDGREFAALRRPWNLRDFPLVTVIVPASNPSSPWIIPISKFSSPTIIRQTAAPELSKRLWSGAYPGRISALFSPAMIRLREG
jgi:hypothetical protein